MLGVYIILLFYLHSDGETLQELLCKHRIKYLRDESQRMVVHLWKDALNRFMSGLDEKKHIKVTFVGEPAVDQGGPLREFFHLLLCATTIYFVGIQLAVFHYTTCLNYPRKLTSTSE